MSESLVWGVFKVAVGFAAATLIALAGTLYASKYHMQQQQRLAAAGDVEGALEAVGLAARLSPFDSEPLVAGANLYGAQGREEAAVAALEEAARRDPANSVNYTTLGTFQLNRMNDPEAAARAFEEALERIPRATNIKSLLATALSRSGDLEGAKREYEELVELERITQQDRFNLGRIYARTGEPEKALETLGIAKDKAVEKLEKTPEGPDRDQREAFVQSVDLAIVDAHVVREDYEAAMGVLEESDSPQAPAILELLRTDPGAYRRTVLESGL